MVNLIKDVHLQEYDTLPDTIASAPCHIHLIGEYSWFFKDKTLSMAINLPVYVAISKRKDSVLKFYFCKENDRKRASVLSMKFKKEDRWANDIKSVLWGYNANGFTLPGMDITIYSEVTSGFGFSTAIKVATAICVQQILGCNEKYTVMAIERGERNFLKTNFYMADIYAAAYSKKGNLIITDHSTKSFENVPFSFEDKKILLIDTRVPQVSLWNEESIYDPENALLLGDLREEKSNVYGGWRYESDTTDVHEVLSAVSEDTRRKLLCIMREHGDILEAHDALLKNDFSKFSRSINHSHESLRDLYNISCPEIDWILKRVSEIEPNLEHLRNPVSCGRITGKSFSRSLYVVIRNSDVPVFNKKLEEYEHIFGFHPSSYDVRPSEGAQLLKA